MKSTIFHILLILFIPKNGLAVVDAINDYFVSKKYKIENFNSYSFKACEKHINDSPEENPYFLTCHNGYLENTNELRNLEGDIQAIEYDVLEDQFLSELKNFSLLSLDEGTKSLKDLESCIVSKSHEGHCESMRLATISSIKKEIPKIRTLMSMKDTPGHIYSPVKPKRYKEENLEHDFTSVEVPSLTESEKNYLDTHITNLEKKFEQEVLSKKEIPGLDKCVQKDNQEQLRLVDSSACHKFEVMVNYRISHLFQRQNKKYKEAYDSLVSNNPILSLVELSGDETDQEILDEVGKKLSILIQNSEELRKKVKNYEGDERIKLTGFTAMSNNFLKNSNASLNGCNIGEKLKRRYKKNQIKKDLLIAAGAIAGGGACALTLGVGCVLAVGVGAEVIAYNNSQSRYDLAKKAFFASQGDHNYLKQKLTHRNLTLFLAPLAVVGGGQLSYVGNNIKHLPSALKGVRKISSRGKVSKSFKKFKGKGSLSNLKEMANFSKLSKDQKKIFYDYLAKLGDKDRDLLMKILSQSENSKDFISRLNLETAFNDLGGIRSLLKAFEKHYILPEGRFVIGKTYQVKLGESSRVREMKVKDYVIDEKGNGLFVISDNIGKRNVTVTDELITIKKASKESESMPILTSFDVLLNMPILLTHGYTNTARLMYRPFLKYKDGSRITFHADKVPSKKMKETADSLMGSMEKFDKSYEKLGFKIPDNTKVIFDDIPLVPSGGPHTYPREIFNVWDGKSSVVIRMDPIIRKTDGVFDESILLHERGHDILHATFNYNAFINKNSTFQEAFADFLFSLNRNVSRNGVGALKEGVPIRDVARREHGGFSGSSRMNDITDMDKSPSHNNSLYISNTLWRLKEQLGTDQVNKLVGGLLDNLNTHRASFVDMRLFKDTKLGKESSEKIHNGTGKVSSDKQVKNLEYFFSVLRKTLADQGSLDKNVETILDTTIKEIGLNPKVIGNIQRKIKPDGVNYREQVGQSSYNRSILIAGSIGVGIDGAAAYYITKKGIEVVDDSISSDD